MDNFFGLIGYVVGFLITAKLLKIFTSLSLMAVALLSLIWPLTWFWSIPVGIIFLIIDLVRLV